MEEIETISNEISSLIEVWEPGLSSLEKSVLSARRHSQNRTIKQIFGHLLDSTSNMSHRVVHLQYQKSPFEFPNYATFGNKDRSDSYSELSKRRLV